MIGDYTCLRAAPEAVGRMTGSPTPAAEDLPPQAGGLTDVLKGAQRRGSAHCGRRGRVRRCPRSRGPGLLPGGVRVDLDRSVPLAGQETREIAGGVADEPAAAHVHTGAVPLRALEQVDHGGLGGVRGHVPDAVVVPLEAARREGGVRPPVLLALCDGHDPGLPAVRQEDLRLSHGPGPRRAGRPAGCARTPGRARGMPPPAGRIRPGPSSARPTRGTCTGTGSRIPGARAVTPRAAQ